MSGEFVWQVDEPVGIRVGAAGTRRRRVEVNAGCTARESKVRLNWSLARFLARFLARERARMRGEFAGRADEHVGITAGAGEMRRCRVKVNSRLHAQTEGAHER